MNYMKLNGFLAIITGIIVWYLSKYVISFFIGFAISFAFPDVAVTPPDSFFLWIAVVGYGLALFPAAWAFGLVKRK